MVKLTKPQKVILNDNEYAVYNLSLQKINFPVVVDWKFHRDIENLKLSWHINDYGYVISSFRLGTKIYETNLHDIIMKLNDQNKNNPIIHINRLGIDNRTSNLMFDQRNKQIKKNTKKKARTIFLPENIDSENIPSFIWYMKPDKSHGERFVANIGNINWKSTSSNKFSLRFKLEQTKKFLRELKVKNNNLFSTFSMNGDLNKEGTDNLNSFCTIAKLSHFDHLNLELFKRNTDYYLKENLEGLSEHEVSLLHQPIDLT
jgi:hypothetical protein